MKQDHFYFFTVSPWEIYLKKAPQFKKEKFKYAQFTFSCIFAFEK